MDREPPGGGVTRGRDARRRQWIAGTVAVVLTALTAVVAIEVNFGAADAHVPSTAGQADRTAFTTEIDRDETPPTDDPWGRPPLTADAERQEHERGHDDDD